MIVFLPSILLSMLNTFGVLLQNIMEHRGANAWRMTVNEKKFIETALLSDLRVDGRRPFDYRRLTIKFGR